MSKRDNNTAGPFIKWVNYGYEGWKPASYDTLEEALADEVYGSPYTITKPVKFIIKEVDDA